MFGKDVTLPDMLDLDRFDVYAPWVMRLDIFDNKTKYTLINSGELRNIASECPILPNLRGLSLSTTDLNISPEDYKSFTELFLCPTLVEIRHVTDNYPDRYLDAGPAYSLAKKILSVCPCLQRLDFYPNKLDLEYHWNSNLICSPDVGFPHILASFSNLRSFNSTSFILKPKVLEAVGSLPQLESLGILDYDPLEETPPALDETFQVLDTWFLALRNLKIYHLHPQDISVVWNQPALVRNLRAVTIRCYPAAPEDEMYDDETELPDGQEWMNEFLADLPCASPHIEELDLEFENFVWDSRRYSLTDSLDGLRRLPLRSVRMLVHGRVFVL